MADDEWLDIELSDCRPYESDQVVRSRSTIDQGGQRQGAAEGC